MLGPLLRPQDGNNGGTAAVMQLTPCGGQGLAREAHKSYMFYLLRMWIMLTCQSVYAWIFLGSFARGDMYIYIVTYIYKYLCVYISYLDIYLPYFSWKIGKVSQISHVLARNFWDGKCCLAQASCSYSYRQGVQSAAGQHRWIMVQIVNG